MVRMSFFVEQEEAEMERVMVLVLDYWLGLLLVLLFPCAPLLFEAFVGRLLLVC